jgi:hypothetical protein
MTADEFEDRIIRWARRQPDLDLLVLAGSRAAKGAADGHSDWDFHLITSQPARYVGLGWLKEIAPIWCAHSALTPRGVIKVSAIFEGGYEADFIPLATWKMKLVYWAMKHPEYAGWMPGILRKGVMETRAFMLGSGYRIMVGADSWGRRLKSLEVPWEEVGMSEDEFGRVLNGFWQKSVWIFKKTVRPEPRSAIHWLHMLIVDHLYALLAEEARIAGRPARPEARKAEQWLDARRLAQTDVVTSLDQKVLARALRSQIDLFDEVSRSVAQSRGFKLPDQSAVGAWLRSELDRIILRS